MSETLIGYKFVQSDMRNYYGRSKPWQVGDKRSVRGPVAPCERGYHASPTAWAALPYAHGPVLCRVKLSGDITPHGDPVDKYAARTQRLLAAVSVERELRLFACRCAEDELPLFEAAYPGDLRPRECIAVSRRYANGEATGEELTAAKAAAWAAWEAARDAARSAAARNAARAAARAAAWAAAWASAYRVWFDEMVTSRLERER